MERSNLIYGIYDTREPDRIRYVGKTTTNLRVRLSNHWTYAKTVNRSAIQRWLWSRREIREVVGIRVLREVSDGDDLDKHEVELIAHYRSQGQADLNHTAGGEGMTGYKRSEESKREISEKYRATGGPSAKLNWAVVREIREWRTREYVGAKEVAAKYGVNRTAVDRILKNQMWFDPGFAPESLKPRIRKRDPRAKLTDEQVREIRALRQQQWIPSRELAKQYGVTEPAMQQILENRNYRDEAYDPDSLVPRGPGDTEGKVHLKPEDVRFIRHRYASGESFPSIAQDTGLTEGHVRNIVSRKSWRGVE